jgi:hypothetical protein
MTLVGCGYRGVWSAGSEPITGLAGARVVASRRGCQMRVRSMVAPAFRNRLVLIIESLASS